MFRPMDLVYPIGLTLLSLVLGIWGAIVAPEVGAKIASGAFAAAALGIAVAFYLMRWRIRRADVVTSYGLRLRFAKGVAPLSRSLVDRWTYDLFMFWADLRFFTRPRPDSITLAESAWIEELMFQRRPLSYVGFSDAVEDVFVNFYAQQKLYLPAWKRYVAGLNDGDVIYLTTQDSDGNFDEERTRSLFVHEITHTLFERVYRLPWNERLHHGVMQWAGFEG